MKIIIRFIACLFFLGGIIHWLIIFNVIQEITPMIVTIYFHSLSILSPLTGLGLFQLKEWGRKLGFYIVITQIPAHAYMIWLDTFSEWDSGVGFSERGLDLVFAVFYIIFFNHYKIKSLFSAKN